jgi:hypothetical protein
MPKDYSGNSAASKKILATKRTGAKTHMGKVNQADNYAQTFDKRLMKPQILDKKFYDKQIANVNKANNKDAVYPTAALGIGHWVRPDRRDTDFEIRRQLLQTGGDKGPDGVSTPYGQMTAGNEVIDYLKDKKKQEEYWYQLKLGSYLIDPKRPETQERAYEMFPELKDYPEQYHGENLALQESIRTMLRDGKLGGQDDNALIAHIMRADFELPLFPVWDPEGIIIKDAAKAGNYFQMLEGYVKRGLFNPRRWGVNEADVPADRDRAVFQKMMKAALLKRLYPGLRDWTMEELTSHFLDYKDSPVTNDAVGNNVQDFFKYANSGYIPTKGGVGPKVQGKPVALLNGG